MPTALVLLLITSSHLLTAAAPDRAVPYKTIGDTTLSLHLFEPEGHSADDARPAIVFFFGGGWYGGSPGQFSPHCQYLAERGMVAISAEYRVQKRDQTTPRECVQDARSALRYVRAHAAGLGIDPARLAAGGGSAGGHVAAATATADDFDEPGEDTAVSCRPDALVLFNPVVDNGPDGYGHKRVAAYWEGFSPLHNIGADIPPSIFFLGTEDKLIPVSVGEAWRDRVVEVGGRCELHVYDGQGHGFFNVGNKPMYHATVTAMDRFLASLGFLEGEPTLAASVE